ncbi:Calcineurin-like phosphoesterase [Pseudarcicella hirudinis]|uniref:Calcineurin-like phosphoesterase n=2 Tax=Pseudarcicella hirudinis TaxID=1079859 RepID=A0A1I5T2Y7_9BACT|nr:metallophosphoesterase [Pseudarcicella hirudinis]SFP77412.1 Calcineurin-like phosphoesterase [Pseudarcicella hirudinis]
MDFSRRAFLDVSLKSIFMIGAGNMLQSFSSDTFKMPAREDVRLRFAVASDGHFGQPETQFEQRHLELVSWINGEKAQRGIDFTVINGDIFHDNPVFLPQAKNVFDQLEMPYFVSHGNHDKVDEPTWKKTWGISLHHSFKKKGTAFMILNTADEGGKYICPDLEWTRNELAKFKNEKELFVFMHITPVSWTKNAIPCPELVEMFDNQANLKGVFHGHDHDQDGVKENNGKYYFFDAHFGGNWGTDYRGYRIVEILKNGEILTYQMNPSSQKQVNYNKIG